MIVRVWKVNVHPERIADLEQFAKTESLPMFNKQPGCLGVLFSRNENLIATISLWDDMNSVEALKTSTSYNATVEKIEATGMLEGKHSIEVFDSFGGYLDLDNISKNLLS